MNAKDVIKTALTSTQQMLGMFLSDLSDADLLVRPVPGANHVAWQLGHLINSERGSVSSNIPGSAYPELPAGWADQHGKNMAAMEPAKGFATKAEYLALFNKVREATLATLAKLSDADLDKPTTGSVAKMAPTLGTMLLLHSNHTLMHAGQFTVLRRKLGKPVIF
jgi:hypothetical protein